MRVAPVAGDQWHKISVKLAKEQINCDGICIGYGFPEMRMGFSGDSAGGLAFVWTCLLAVPHVYKAIKNKKS